MVACTREIEKYEKPHIIVHIYLHNLDLASCIAPVDSGLRNAQRLLAKAVFRKRFGFGALPVDRHEPPCL